MLRVGRVAVGRCRATATRRAVRSGAKARILTKALGMATKAGEQTLPLNARLLYLFRGVVLGRPHLEGTCEPGNTLLCVSMRTVGWWREGPSRPRTTCLTCWCDGSRRVALNFAVIQAVGPHWGRPRRVRDCELLTREGRRGSYCSRGLSDGGHGAWPVVGGDDMGFDMDHQMGTGGEGGAFRCDDNCTQNVLRRSERGLSMMSYLKPTHRMSGSPAG